MSTQHFKYKQDNPTDTLEFLWSDPDTKMECVFILDKLEPNDDNKSMGVSYSMSAHTKNFDSKVFEPQLQELIIELMSDAEMLDNE